MVLPIFSSSRRNPAYLRPLRAGVVGVNISTKAQIQTQTKQIPLNSTEIELGSGDKPKVVTWLKANETEVHNSPSNSINNQEF
jgi:hypothetical protein